MIIIIKYYYWLYIKWFLCWEKYKQTGAVISLFITNVSKPGPLYLTDLPGKKNGKFNGIENGFYTGIALAYINGIAKKGPKWVPSLSLALPQSSVTLDKYIYARQCIEQKCGVAFHQH